MTCLECRCIFQQVMRTIPLFKTHFSIGKSILTIDKIFELADSENQIVIVDESFSGLRRIVKKAKNSEKKVRFGLRIDCSNEGGDSSKVILFAKNNKGIKVIKNIYSKAFTKREGVCDFNDIKDQNVLVAIPFYDSFLHKSIHNFGNYNLPIQDLTECWIFIEENGHPFDYQIQREIELLKEKGFENLTFKNAKTILYEKSVDFPAFQGYKSSCNRKMGGRQINIDAPELEDCSSDKFSWEQYKYGREEK